MQMTWDVVPVRVKVSRQDSRSQVATSQLKHSAANSRTAGSLFRPKKVYAIICVFLLTFPSNQMLVKAFPVSEPTLKELQDQSKSSHGSGEAEAKDILPSHSKRHSNAPRSLPSLYKLHHKRRHEHHTKIWLKKNFERYIDAPSNAQFQELAGIKETGKIDKETMLKMRAPRCGNPDVENVEHSSERKRTKRFVPHSKWSSGIDQDKPLTLRWNIGAYTKDVEKHEIRKIVSQAFKIWSTQISIPSIRTPKLNFEEAKRADKTDINILWARREHGDTKPFDDAGDGENVLAHTFYPDYKEGKGLNGDIHFDDYEKWTVDVASTDEAYLPYVLVHEIGHSLGLAHSRGKNAIMNPIYTDSKRIPMESISLDIDDKCAVSWNYGPTDTCLFVWLMVELLPQAKESNVSMPSVKSTDGLLQIGTDTSDKLGATLAALKGPVVCNFLKGLSDLVQDPASLKAAMENHKVTDSSLESGNIVVDRTSRSVTAPESTKEGEGKTIWDEKYFDKKFFSKLFQLILRKDERSNIHHELLEGGVR